MALFDEHPLSELDRKTHQILGDKVVIKALSQQAAFQGLPRYVSEYLIAKYVKPETWRDDLAKMQAKVKELLPDLEQRELLFQGGNLYQVASKVVGATVLVRRQAIVMYDVIAAGSGAAEMNDGGQLLFLFERGPSITD